MASDWPFNDDSEDPASGAPNVAEFTVSELSFALKRTVEDTYGYVRVRGELGRVSRPASGHLYLDLKDDKAVLNGIVWKGVASRLRVQPEQGLEVIVTGKLTTYPGQSKYQIVIESMEPAGVGALMALLEERRKKLAAEGLFDDDRKRRIPYLPRVIGVVTSPTGAVIRDILHRLADRFPSRVVVWPVRVQGETCGQEVAAAIHGFNALDAGGPIARPDLIIVARGGGSLEDLWGFNDEDVVRAASDSTIPLISAVGHETDWTLIDHVADERAPTPTAAAERAVPVRSELMALVDDLSRRKAQGLQRLRDECRSRLLAASRGLPKRNDLLALPRQRFDSFADRLGHALRTNTQIRRSGLERTSALLSRRPLDRKVRQSADHIKILDKRGERAFRRRIEIARARYETSAKLLSSLSYRSVLERGFALVRDADGAAMRSAATAVPGAPISVEFHDGIVSAHLDEDTGGTTPAKKPPARKSPASTKTGGDQGKLF